MSALHVFQKFVSRDSNGNVDVSGILSRKCYEAWLKTREVPPKDPEEAFRKVLTGPCKFEDISSQRSI